ncbi:MULTISPECIES: helix-turn-helix domain-containing protein [Bacteroidota]|uniref:helix-turn-helix domain-containing protein n=1 Tax=Bacteroidota TaxID=976 RepID=UPI001CBAF974|nr:MULTISPECIES: helix-turn-helix domain-containing protein [Bacteroidota]MBZ4190813.1 helix-turn-helix domain-containing protein [Niabella beijingensis]UMQ40796.1 helix-turn-helix domain-containing protein [Chryseobacterium sp. Y16C]
MEVIAIPKSVLKEMTAELDELLQLATNASEAYIGIFNEERWLDNQEVCLMLGISKRTLQSYKDKGLLPFSKLNRKNYYKFSDVQHLLASDAETENK